MTPFRTRNASLRGFSLTELAVVLGIVGVVVGAIWGFTGPAYEGARREQFAEQLFVVVKNVRAAYMGQAGVCGTFAQLTLRLASQGSIPGDMVRGHNLAAGIVDNPWGAQAANGGLLANGSFAVGAGAYAVASAGTSALATPCSAAASQQYFTVELRGLRTESCIAVATRNSAAASPPGLADVVINGTSMATGAATSKALPVRVTDAQTYCPAAAGATVDFVYRLRPPAF